MRACAFFPPSLAPVLDGRKGHKDAVVAPQGPTRWALGQAVLDHEPHRQSEHAVGVRTARWRQSRQGSREVLLTFRTIVLRRGDEEIPGPPEGEIAQVVQRPLGLLIPIRLMTTTGTCVSLLIATVWDDLWRWEVGRDGNTFRGIGSLRTRTEHRFTLLAQMLDRHYTTNVPWGPS
jgi:hypothetical protein